MTRFTPEDLFSQRASPTVGLHAEPIKRYHVFLASPGDVNDERNMVRQFFKAYNINYAESRGLNFEVIDWENFSTAGVGRPQELITKQTLTRYKNSLALVIGIMAQRFGSNSGTHESGTEEEYEWAINSQKDTGFPEVKWFFRDVKEVKVDPDDPNPGLLQWEKVRAFRKRLDASKTLYSRSYKDINGFGALLENDVSRWLNDPQRPWFKPGQPSTIASSDWPQHVVESLFNQLNDEFAFHMKAGEDLSFDEARARYVESVLKLRGDPDSESDESEDHSLPAEGPLEDFLESDGVQLLVIGTGGSGKTTMLKRQAAEGARRAAQNSNAPVFIYFRLTSFDRNDGGLDLLLDRLSLAARLDRKEFEMRWREGRRPIVFLLDGLNEVAQTYQPSCTQALRTLLQNSPHTHRYVITSRPGGEFEAVASRSTETCDLRVAELQKFGPEQVQKYLQAQGRPELQPRISERLEDLASNPFLL